MKQDELTSAHGEQMQEDFHPFICADEHLPDVGANGSAWKNTVAACMMKKRLPGEEHPCFAYGKCPWLPMSEGAQLQVTAQAL